MSASPGFHSGYWAVPALIGIHAFPPSLSCESFWVLNTVHFIHFHFHICYCYHRAELFRVSPQLLFLSLKHELSVRIHTNTTMRTQFLCAIHLVAFDKKFTWQGWTLLKTPCLDTWNDIAHESIKRSSWKEKNLHRIVFGFIFDPFALSWSGSSTGDQTFNWSEELNSWLNF